LIKPNALPGWLLRRPVGLSAPLSKPKGQTRVTTLDFHPKGYLVDLDGTLISGGALLPGAETLLAHLNDQFVIVSNDSENTPVQLEKQFKLWGLTIPADRILLAGTSAVDVIASQTPNARIMILGSVALHRYARKSGLSIDQDRPDVVLVARDRRFIFKSLYAAVNAVRAGATLTIACPDVTHPGPDGKLVPEAGALAAAILACVGNVVPQVIGKPEPALFHLGCQRLGISAHDAVMIGDNPLTDGAGAIRAGMRYAQVAPNEPLSFFKTALFDGAV
jgi:HAD superfamily hydrolase (TIGR01450 family)